LLRAAHFSSLGFIRESFLSTNSKICQTLNLIGDFSGTTVLMTWLVGQKIVVANAGDSRAVLYKDSGTHSARTHSL
jgi:serine/threonine protein phosphatase PrpC